MKITKGILLLSLLTSTPGWSMGYLSGNLQPGTYSLSANTLTTQHVVTTLGVEAGFYIPYFSRNKTSLSLVYELGEGVNRGNDISFQESLRAQNISLHLQSHLDKWLLGLGINQRHITITSVSTSTSAQTKYQGITPELIIAYKLGSELLAPWMYFNYSVGALNSNLSFQSIQLGARLTLGSQ